MPTTEDGIPDGVPVFVRESRVTGQDDEVYRELTGSKSFLSTRNSPSNGLLFSFCERNERAKSAGHTAEVLSHFTSS